ncbi:MAG: VIT domain-containing protein [Hyphomicrobium sp.]|nr:VIT domain-containing protein [Hyphomicrobium sp.]
MSERKRDGAGAGSVIEWTPNSPPGGTPPRLALRSKLPRGTLHAVFGVVLPVAVLVIELVTGICAEALFDPIPTWGHVALVALVPAVNLAGIYFVRRAERAAVASPRWLALLFGCGLAVSAFYALLFLPLMPLAAVAILFYGLGLLPMAPLAGFVSMVILRRMIVRRSKATDTRMALGAGVVAGTLLLIALDLPPALTRLGLDWAASADTRQREQGLSLIRSFGDRDHLLRVAYDVDRRPGGPLTLLMGLGSSDLVNGQMRIAGGSSDAAREVFFRAYGTPFNAEPAPRARRGSVFWNPAFDGDHGGPIVGQRIAGLDLVGSRLDGSVAGDDAVAYFEWTIEFRNQTALDREARLALALPPGGVVSRATLWINGEEREAAFGGRGQTRAAYESVAVAQRRDPLLVTTKGADRVLAQAFPVPRDGGTIKFKLGITAPLELAGDDTASVVLPAILERNFDIGADFRHAVWVESPSPFVDPSAGFAATVITSDRFRLQSEIADTTLTGKRPSIEVRRDPAVVRKIAPRDGGAAIEQRIVQRMGPDADALMLVIDGSIATGTHRSALLSVLDAIPVGRIVGLAIASATPVEIDLKPWDEDQRARFENALRSHDFVGGQDNAPALGEAIGRLEHARDGVVFWVHGPQPIAFTDGSARLEQLMGRIERMPRLLMYEVAAGPNEVLPDAPWAWRAQSVPATGNVARDLEGTIRRVLGGDARFDIVRRPVGTDTSASGIGSAHISRLWAQAAVLDLMARNGERGRVRATALATENQLVTPVSGAVVLETKAQYDAHQLKPVAQGTVPTVPEPHEWVLIILASLMIGHALWRQRVAVERRR